MYFNCVLFTFRGSVKRSDDDNEEALFLSKREAMEHSYRLVVSDHRGSCWCVACIGLREKGGVKRTGQAKIEEQFGLPGWFAVGI